MEKMRCLENIVESVLGARAMPHSIALHQWYASRQSKKSSNDDEAIKNKFAVSTTKSMKQYVGALEAAETVRGRIGSSFSAEHDE